MAVAATKRILKGLALSIIFSAFAINVSAEDYAVAQGYAHGFNNGISVYSGVFALNKDVSLDTAAYFKYSVDLINPDKEDEDEGSVAVVSGASSAVNTANDTRNAVTLGVSHNFSNIIGVEAYYDYSHEKDYASSTPTITFKKDLFEKNTTITAGYSRNADTIDGRFMDSSQDKTTDNYFVGLTQVVSPVTIAQIGYSNNNSRGQQSEGIRLVPVDGADASTCTAESVTCVDEAFPGNRVRQAYLAGVNHYFVEGAGGFLDRSSVKLTVRYYDDSWDIDSYTGEVEFNKYISEDLVLRLDYRYYTQSKAFFVKDSYSSSDELRSSSPQLLEKDTNLYGVKLTYNLRDSLKTRLFNTGIIEGKYEYYSESIGVNAHVLMAGLRMAF